MAALIVLGVLGLGVCMFRSPTSRWLLRSWASRARFDSMMPRNVFMGCGLWLLVIFFAWAVIWAGIVAIAVASPLLAAFDVVRWWRRKR